jgi:hypothetical protein
MTPPPLIVAPDAGDSELPIRHAAAVVVRDVDGRVFLAQRSQQVTEFRGVWSFPSASAGSAQAALDGLIEGLREWFGWTAEHWQLCARRLALRPAWRLEMSLYTASVAAPPRLLAAKYDQVRWTDPAKVIAGINEGAGDCMLAFKDHVERSSGTRAQR